MNHPSNQALNNNILKHLWEHSQEAIFTIAYDGAVLQANPAFEQLLGWHLGELRGIAYPPFLEDMTRTEQGQFLAQLKKGKDFPFEIRKRRQKDGSVLSILASYHAVNEGDVLAVAMYKDFTEHMNIQRRLQESEYNYRILIENLPEAIIKKRDGKINLINSAGVALLGRQQESDVLGYSLWDFVESEAQEEIEQAIDQVSQLGYQYEAKPIMTKIKCPNRVDMWVEITLLAVKKDDMNEVQLVIRDITSKRKNEARLEFLAYHDPLTGLKNRRIFTDIMSASITQARKTNVKLAVMYIDIDYFKSINDSLGHRSGDELLKLFAKRLSNTIREDDVACRIGGDEFLVLLNNIGSRKALERIAKRMLTVFQVPFLVEEKEVNLTISIGLSLYPEDGMIGRDLIHHADIALYKAKQKRNTYTFYTSSS